MPRSNKEWIGKTDDSRPTRACLLRVFDSAGGKCCICGIKLGNKGWEADHIVRLKDHGENRESNLQAVCKPCHLEKTGAENKLQAKANKIRYKSVGIKKRPTRLAKPGGYRYNWQNRRYEPE